MKNFKQKIKSFLSSIEKRYRPLIFNFFLKYIYKRTYLNPQKLLTENRLDLQLAIDFLNQVINEKVRPKKVLFYHYLNDMERGEFLKIDKEIDRFLKFYEEINLYGLNKWILVKKYRKNFIKTSWTFHKKVNFKNIKNDTGFQLVDNFYLFAIALFLNLDKIPCVIINDNFINRHIMAYNSTEIIKKRRDFYELLTVNDELRDLHLKIYSIYSSNRQHFGSGYYYQGFNEIKISGRRPTEYRFKKYGIEQFLRNDNILLDIGSNLGFFTILCSKYVKWAYGLEINKSLVEIGNLVKNYLKIENCTFITEGFERFKSNLRYNIIISNATHNWIPISIEEYISKIYNILDENGIVLFELNKIEKELIREKNLDYIINSKFEIIEKGIIKDDGITQRPFYILKKL